MYSLNLTGSELKSNLKKKISFDNQSIANINQKKHVEFEVKELSEENENNSPLTGNNKI